MKPWALAIVAVLVAVVFISCSSGLQNGGGLQISPPVTASQSVNLPPDTSDDSEIDQDATIPDEPAWTPSPSPSPSPTPGPCNDCEPY